MLLRNCGILGPRVGSQQGDSLATPRKPAHTLSQQQTWVPAVIPLVPELMPPRSAESAGELRYKLGFVSRKQGQSR